MGCCSGDELPVPKYKQLSLSESDTIFIVY